jgi:hypothetical protein
VTFTGLAIIVVLVWISNIGFYLAGRAYTEKERSDYE